MEGKIQLKLIFALFVDKLKLIFEKFGCFGFSDKGRNTFEGLGTLVLFGFEVAAQKEFVVGDFGVVFVEILAAQVFHVSVQRMIHIW